MAWKECSAAGRPGPTVSLARPAARPLQVRCSRYLYTLCVTDSDKADKLKQSLPPGACVR